MGNIIAVLPDSIANQIAAGEVIQRPASVVKELLENAVDAGADEIDLIIKESGRQLVQVIDNGKGMSPLDARLCWERHATSKIKTAEDLFALHTFGFRGEALASIASVAQVELKTRQEKEDIGTHLIIEASEVKKQDSCVHPRGTNISVKNLFYNIPARRNFLKSNAVELKHIVDEFVRVALPNEGVSLRLLHNDHCLYDLKAGSRKKRIAEVFGQSEKDFFFGEEHSSAGNFSLFLGAPSIAKKTRGEQFFIVNGRFIKDAYLNHAIQQEYKAYLPADCHAGYVVFLDLNPASIDVNVHPTKTEIKFEDERTLYAMMKSVVRKTLAQHHLGNGEEQLFSHDSFQQLLHSTPRPEFPTQPKVQVNKGFNPFDSDISRKKNAVNPDWQNLYADLHFPAETPKNQPLSFPELMIDKANIPLKSEGVLPLMNGLLAVKTCDDLLIVDQELAHQRVLYERFLNQVMEQKSSTQQLLFPRVVEFSPIDAALLEEILEEIRHLGFDINSLGGGSFIINGLPPDSNKADAQTLLEGLVEEYKLTHQLDKRDKQRDVARALAKKSAIKRQDHLDKTELNRLIHDLFNCLEPGFSPFGKPVFVKLTPDFLTQLFQKA